MGLPEMESIVFGKADDVVEDVVKSVVEKTNRYYGEFVSRIFLGIFLVVVGLAVFIIGYSFLSMFIIYVSGLAILVIGLIVLGLAFTINLKLETATLRLYPVKLVGLGFGDFIAIDPFGNGEEIVLPKYSIDDANRIDEYMDELQRIIEESYSGRSSTKYVELSDRGATLVLTTPLKNMYEVLRDIVEKAKSIGREEYAYNVIPPEERDIPIDIIIPLDKSGFSEELVLGNRISLEEIDEKYEEITSIHKNWEDIVDKLKDLTEKLKPLHGQVNAHFEWIRKNYGDIIRGVLRKTSTLMIAPCPHCLLTRNFLAEPDYQKLSPLIISGEGGEAEKKLVYQCGSCGYRVETDIIGIPQNTIILPSIDEYFNRAWLGIWRNYERRFKELIDDNTGYKNKVFEELSEKYERIIGDVRKSIEEYRIRVDEYLLDVKPYTDILEKLGLKGSSEAYKYALEHSIEMEKVLSRSISDVKGIIDELIAIRLDPDLYNKLLLETRIEAATTMGREDVRSRIISDRSTLLHDKILSLLGPLIIGEEIGGGEEGE